MRANHMVEFKLRLTSSPHNSLKRRYRAGLSGIFLGLVCEQLLLDSCQRLISARLVDVPLSPE